MRRKTLSRFQKVDCLVVAGVNLEKKSKAKGIDESERRTLKSQVENLRSDAMRHLFVASIIGDKFSTFTTGLQAASE